MGLFMHGSSLLPPVHVTFPIHQAGINVVSISFSAVFSSLGGIQRRVLVFKCESAQHSRVRVWGFAMFGSKWGSQSCIFFFGWESALCSDLRLGVIAFNSSSSQASQRSSLRAGCNFAFSSSGRRHCRRDLILGWKAASSSRHLGGRQRYLRFSGRTLQNTKRIRPRGIFLCSRRKWKTVFFLTWLTFCTH